MAVYTVHAPPNAADPAEVAFVREGFSWPAFAFGPLWLARHTLWLALLAWVVWIAAFAAGVWLLKLPANASLMIFLAGQTFLGLEAKALLRDKLTRRGFSLVDVVVGNAREEIETMFFRRRAHARKAAAVAIVPQARRAAAASSGVQDAIGLFPNVGDGR